MACGTRTFTNTAGRQCPWTSCFIFACQYMKIPTDLDPKPPLRRILAQNPPFKEFLDPPLTRPSRRHRRETAHLFPLPFTVCFPGSKNLITILQNGRKSTGGNVVLSGDGFLGFLALFNLANDGHLRVERETLAFLSHLACTNCR